MRHYLLSGFDFADIFDGDEPTEETARQAWNELREELLADHIAKHPGTRPWGWWAYTFGRLPLWREGSQFDKFSDHLDNAFIRQHLYADWPAPGSTYDRCDLILYWLLLKDDVREHLEFEFLKAGGYLSPDEMVLDAKDWHAGIHNEGE
jgi:hypothetical protein